MTSPLHSPDINYSNFLDQFERLASTDYLKIEPQRDEGQCFSFTTRRGKNLNNERLLNIIEQAFAYLIRNQAFENREAFTQRQIRVNRLAQAVQTYGIRLKQSAPWYWKVLTFFGFQRLVDKRVNQLFSNLSEVGATQASLTESLERKFRAELAHPPEYLRFFYHFVLGSTSLKIDKLEGAKPASFQHQYYSLLQEFQSTLMPDSPAYLAIQGVMRQLSFGSQISIAQNFQLPLNAFMEHLNAFLLDPTQKTCMIPGGTPIHNVLFEIEREENGTFTLRMIDTGVIAGNLYLLENETFFTQIAHLSQTGWYRTILNEHPSIDQKISQCQELIELEGKNKTQDLHYTELTAAHFSESFIQTLFAFKRGRENDMNDIVAFLTQQLATSNKSNLIVAGRAHTRQIKGVCAQKAFASWLHGRLGNELYQQFKVFYTIREIERLEHLFAEQSTVIEELLSTCTFSQRDKSVSEQTGDCIINESELEMADIFDSELPLSEEEQTSLPAALEKHTKWLELLKNISFSQFSESIQHWSPQEAKEEIRQLAHQVLRNRQQKLERLLAAQAA